METLDPGQAAVISELLCMSVRWEKVAGPLCRDHRLAVMMKGTLETQT